MGYKFLDFKEDTYQNQKVSMELVKCLRKEYRATIFFQMDNKPF